MGIGVQILSYSTIKNLDTDKKVKKIIKIIQEGKIVMLEGRLEPKEEYEITKSALKKVNDDFSGIEIGFLSSDSSNNFVEKIKNKILELIAKNRFGITVIGPSKIIKEIKMDPNKLEVLLE